MKKCISLLLALVLCLSMMSMSLAEDKAFAGHSLVFTTWGDSAEQAATQAICDKFTADTGCEVNLICINENYDTKVTAMIAAARPSTWHRWNPAPSATSWWRRGNSPRWMITWRSPATT